MPQPPTLDLTGRVALVTGGTKGLGRGIAERFLAAGATVVICGRNAPEAPVAADGREAEFLPADVRDADAVAALVDTIADRHGRVDVAVNNAGGSPSTDAATASPRFSASIVTLNLLAPLYVAQRAYGVMAGQDDGGVILNIGSVSGLRPSPGTAAYGAAKAGLASLTRSLAMEWGPKVRLNYVAVGLLRTEQSHLHYGSEEGLAAVAATIPLGRLAEPAEVADVCLFLASPLARYVSGATVEVHGGGEPPVYLSAAAPFLTP